MALLRFREGFADYQRVLDAQQAQFTQQGRYVGNKSNIVKSFIALYVSLGGGWQGRENAGLVSEESLNMMRERSDWGELLNSADQIQTSE
jgi:hypothetical protein